MGLADQYGDGGDEDNGETGGIEEPDRARGLEGRGAADNLPRCCLGSRRWTRVKPKGRWSPVEPEG